MSGVGPDGPEWTGPAADYRRDLTVLTSAVRGGLDRAVRTVNATLGMNRQAAPQRLTHPYCRRKCRIPCGSAAEAPPRPLRDVLKRENVSPARHPRPVRISCGRRLAP